jgi:hypothetical protein
MSWARGKGTHDWIARRSISTKVIKMEVDDNVGFVFGYETSVEKLMP